MSELEKCSLIDDATKCSSFFEVNLVIKIFGHVVINYTWPPKKL